jgi:hypothetical protein
MADPAPPPTTDFDLELDRGAFARIPGAMAYRIALGGVIGLVAGAGVFVGEWIAGWIGGWIALAWLGGFVIGGGAAGAAVGWVRARRRAFHLMLIESRLVEQVVRRLVARAERHGEDLATHLRSMLDAQVQRLPSWLRGATGWIAQQLASVLVPYLRDDAGDPVERATGYVSGEIGAMGRTLAWIAIALAVVLAAAPVIVRHV